MKTIDVLKNLGMIRDLKSSSDNERNSPVPTFEIDNDNEFTFSTEYKSENTGGLKEILLIKPQTPQEQINANPKTKKLDYHKPKPEYKSRSKSPTANLPSFKPSINPKSQKLAKLAEKKKLTLKKEDPRPQPNPIEIPPEKKMFLLKDFLNRNYTQQLLKAEGKKQPRAITPLDRVDEQCTFKPLLDKNSRELVGTHRIYDLYELGEKQKEEKKNKCEEALRKKQDDELSKCTFTPKILKKINVSSKVNSRQTHDINTYSNMYYRNVSPKPVSATVDYLDISN